MESPGEEYQRHMEVVRELNERVATVHERVACPKCGAVVGDRCHRVGTAYLPGYKGYAPPPLKHLHAERLRAGGIPLVDCSDGD